MCVILLCRILRINIGRWVIGRVRSHIGSHRIETGHQSLKFGAFRLFSDRAPKQTCQSVLPCFKKAYQVERNLRFVSTANYRVKIPVELASYQGSKLIKEECT